ncbi:siderophore ABC transporter substrate-binding protein [Metabacillus fastidiosus]|uniref:siderophore ABC transporter substrate-binding protein n=1 Tax=Metabacillus fastidiosus TaxID=1458 RepID=UPI002E229F4A|nr:siderophore ABC transporter substrate-binding protein [Metabacillus fastidiosus]
MKKVALFLLTCLLVIIAAACGANDSSNGAEKGSEPKGDKKEAKVLTIKHELGETKLEQNPKKVVVFDFGALDTLDALGVEVAGVPQANIPPYLSKYEDKKYENVGSLKEPDFEKIAEIDPDLILISGRQSESYEEFTKLAPTVYVGVDTAKYMESFKTNMEVIGQIFDKEDVIKEELANIDKDIEAVKEKAAGDKKSLIILTSGGKISAYGPGSRFGGIIHDVLGVPAVEEKLEVSTHGQNISPEFISEKNPDYLFVIDRDAAVGEGEGAKKVVENELVKNTNAFKNEKITYLDPSYWYLSGGGLVSVKEMIKEVKEGIE